MPQENLGDHAVEARACPDRDPGVRPEGGGSPTGRVLGPPVDTGLRDVDTRSPPR